MWSKLPPRFVARMLSGHTVVGLAASVLLYVLCLSGTVMVFHEEFQRWEQPGVPEFTSVEPAVVHRAALNGLDSAATPPHHFFIGMPVSDFPRMTVTADETAWYADADGDLVAEMHHPWRDFLESLHYYLTLPGVLGLTVVGILGMLMTALTLSGILSHPKLFRDAFKLRSNGNRRLRETDTHNRLGTWAAPFHLVIAFTGAVLGLASIAAFVLGSTVDDGGVENFFAPIFGTEAEGDKAVAPLADITAALGNFNARHPDLLAWYVSFHDPATAGQSAEILAQHPRRVVYGDNYYFNAAGEITGNTGLSNGTAGQQIAASLYPLHFGSFGGLFVKLAYGIFGVLACVVVASGINIWLLKRRQRGRASPVLERTWQAVVWGAPAAMAVVLLMTCMNVASAAWLTGTFWGALLLFMSAAALTRGIAIRGLLQQLTAALLIATVLLHLFRNIGGLASPAAWGVSTVLIVLAAWLLRLSMTGKPLTEKPAMKNPVIRGNAAG